MAWGVWANVAVTALASGAYAAAAIAAQRRQRAMANRTGPAPVFFGIIALFLLLAATRQVAAVVAPPWDLRIYFLNVPFAALVIVPHAYLVTLVRTGRHQRAGQVALVFLLVVTVGIVAALLGGATEEPRTDFGTDWALESAVARILIIVAILLPGLIGSAWLVRLARHLGARERRRIRLIGWAALGYFVLFTIDAYGLSGPALLLARVLTAGTGALAWWAYQDAEPIVHTYSPPRGKPGENPFER